MPACKIARLSDAATWPKSVRYAIQSAVAALMFSLHLARERAFNRGGWHADWATKSAQSERKRQNECELDLLRRRLESVPPKHRPYCSPADRLTILRLAWANGWSAEETARRFVLSVPTVRRWFRVWRGEKDPGLFFGRPAWNRLSDAVRALVHEAKLQLPESGTRTLALQLRQAAIKLSRATVQRILRQKSPRQPPAADAERTAKRPEVKPYHLLRPTQPNRVWHVDMTEVRVLFFRFKIAAILDGYSRKLLALSVVKDPLTTAKLLKLIKIAVAHYGTPRFLISDNGAQFKDRFRTAVTRLGIAHIQSRPKHPEFNGKIERFFRTLKLWQRIALLFPSTLQTRLDEYRNWYNQHRVHQGIGGLTPEQAWSADPPPVPVRYLARDCGRVRFRLKRLHYAGDPRLPILSVQVFRDCA